MFVPTGGTCCLYCATSFMTLKKPSRRFRPHQDSSKTSSNHRVFALW